MSYRFHPEALEEYQEATIYYVSAIRCLRCGSLRLSRMQSAEFLKQPQRWRVPDDDVRRCLTRGFPTEFCTPSNLISSLSLL